jgi:predicted site-specific integrase-resolvase
MFKDNGPETGRSTAINERRDRLMRFSLEYVEAALTAEGLRRELSHVRYAMLEGGQIYETIVQTIRTLLTERNDCDAEAQQLVKGVAKIVHRSFVNW